MKKLFFFIVSAFIMTVALRAQDISTQDSVKFSHWSVAVNIGANMVDADMIQEFNQVFPNALVRPTAGGSIEYSFSPIFGLGLNYIYLPSASTYETEFSEKYWKTEMHHVSLYASINLLNLFYRNKSSKWNIYFNVGGGLAFYDAEYKDHGPVGDLETVIPLKDGRSGAFPLGLNVEYNISKSFALGLDYKFIGHNKDNIEGDPRGFRGTTNDFIHAGTLGVRWKIGAQNKPHVRNINMSYFERNEGELAKEAMKTAKEAKEAALEAQLTADDLRGRVGVLENRTDRIEPQVNYLSQLLADGPDADGDGVPDHRDREPNTSPNTVVDFWGRTVFSVGGVVEPPAVLFEFDKANIDAEAQQTIRDVAAKLKSDETLLVEVRGYADYIGNVEYNLVLSQRRAERVKEELVRVHGINPERIITNGKGRIIEPRSKYKYNRRCDFFFSR
jgi:outer membrane protein OmpA-like peptidoglycan-associated protein/opacity protein-like surface antigen